jgi:hypothetical protein
VGLEPTTSRLTAERICQIELPRTELLRIVGYDGRKLSDSSLDLGVAVRAQQHALGDLRTRTVERSPNAPVGDAEVLRRAVDVVELQSTDVTVVATQPTRAARLVDERRLDLAPTRGDRLRTALAAPQTAPSTTAWRV